MTAFFFFCSIAKALEITDLRNCLVIYVTDADNVGNKLQMFPVLHVWLLRWHGKRAA